MSKQQRPVPTKVTLEQQDEVAYIRVYADNTKLGYYNVTCMPVVTGACLPKLRKRAKAHAKSLGVPYEDRCKNVSPRRR